MKTVTLSIILLVIYIVHGVQSECCELSTLIEFISNLGVSCNEIYGAQERDEIEENEYNCRINVCGDGKHHEGIYCGKRKCNIFGCKCDGGCFPGNKSTAVESFKTNYGNKSRDAQLCFSD